MHFESSFGHRLEVVPGYKDLFPTRLTYMRDAKDENESHRKSLATGVFVRPEETSLSFKGYWGRLAHIHQLRSALASCGLPTNYVRALDIGCGSGIHASLIRGTGIASESHGIDLIDRVPPDIPKRLKHHDKAFVKKAAMRALERIRVQSWVSPDLAEGLSRASPAYQHEQFYGEPLDQRAMSRLRLRHEPKLDKLILGDVFDPNSTPQSYDLVASFNTLTLIDVEKLIPRVAEVLSPGGVFYFTFAHWWFPANAWGLTGDLPFGAQRLTKDDYLRFIKQFHPDEYDLQAGAYAYFPDRPISLNQCLDLAASSNLDPVYVRRFIPRGIEDSRGPSTHELVRAGMISIPDIMRDIRQIRTDVTVDDLFASRVAAVLVKRVKASGLAQRVHDTHAPVKDPSRMFRLAKSAYLKLFAKKR